MRDRRAFRGLTLAGMAGAGVVLGHWIAYALAVPSAHLRTEILAETGHVYWPLAVKSAVALTIAGMGALTLKLAAGSPPGDESRSRVFFALLWRLGLAQIIAFTVLEVSERMAIGLSLATLWHHHLFLVGLAVQVVMAVAGSLLLLGFRRAVIRVLAAVRRVRPRRAGTVALRPALVRLHHRPVVAEPGVGRAPPSF
jgi:hypothetical protein